MVPGFPSDGSKPMIVRLGDSITSMPSTSDTAYAMAASASSCTLVDNRETPVVDGRFGYALQTVGGQQVYGDSRWISEEGKLKKATVTKQASGTLTVSRVDPSERFPTFLGTTGTSRSIHYSPVQKTDGVEFVTLMESATGAVSYNFRGKGDIVAPRKNGPTFLAVNAAGLITDYSYTNAAGTSVTAKATGTTNSQIIANYNATTGQSWDGSFPKVSQFDLSVPFQPLAP